MYKIIRQGTHSTSLFLFYPLLFILVTVFISFPVFGSQKKHLKVRVGSYENRPKIYTNENGVLAGIFPDILEEIASREGWELEYVPGTWAQCLERLEKNEIDIMVDVAFSEKRNEKYEFSEETVFVNWGTIYTRNGFSVESLLDLGGRKVATMKESIHTEGESGIKSLAETFEVEVDFKEVDSYREVFDLLDSGQADAGVVNRLFGTLSEKDYAVDKSSLIFNPRHLKFAFSKGSSLGLQLRERIDYHLAAQKKDSDSIFYEIINSYLSGIEYKSRHNVGIKLTDLTTEEKEWLKAHQKVRIGVDLAYAPYSFIDPEGRYQGIAMDFVDLINKELGIEMEVVPGLSWPQIMEGARNRTLDLVLTAAKTIEREEYLNFTGMYLQTPLVIMTRLEDQVIDGPEDLAGKKIALVKEYATSERVVKEYPTIRGVMVDTPLEGLQAVSAGEALGYVGVLGVNDHLVKKFGISNLKVAARYDMRTFGQHIAVRKDWPLLATIIDKVLTAIPEKKKMATFNKWISSQTDGEGSFALQEKYALTEAETAWVKAHPEILLGADPEFAPFEFFSKEGKYSGLASDYITILNKRLGLNMKVVSDLTWKDVVDKIEKKDLDVLPCVGITEHRKSFLNFSVPYVNFHRVIVTRTDTPFLAGLDDIENLKVAVQSGSSHEGYLKDHTKLKPQLYKTLQEGLVAISDGSADAFIGNVASVTYWIRKQSLTNLKVAAPVSQDLQSLHFAVRNDWPELIPIINKGLQSISKVKDNQIRKRWISMEYSPGLNPIILKTYVLKTIGVALVILCIVLAWNFRLAREIRKRKEVEEALSQAHEVVEQRVKDRTTELATANLDLQREITERKRSEKEKEELEAHLLQAHKMESIGTLAGGIAHDFNNILSSILGFTELALGAAKRGLKIEDDLQEVYKAGLRAKDLVQQILTFARQSEEELKPIRVDSIIKEVLKLIRSSIPTSIEIKQNIASDSHIMGNSTQVHQIMMNLCTNSAQAMENEGGTLEITLRDITIDRAIHQKKLQLKSGNYIELKVSDTGTGIEPHIIEKIFDPYFTTKKKGEGTGMGLALVHGIVETYGGEMTVESTLGKGTAFTIYLPSAREKTTLLIDKTDELSTGKERILLVDDETSIVKMTSRMLGELGYFVTTKTSSVDALELFTSDPSAFDLVMSDVTMPKMTGEQLSESLIGIRPDIPIVLCTGYSKNISEKNAADIGVKAFIYKPITKADLAQTVRNVLDEG